MEMGSYPGCLLPACRGQLRIATDTVLQIVEALCVADQKQVLDLVRDQQVPDLLEVGDLLL